jgi:hypothetical protein
LREFSFNSSGQPIRSGHFAVITVHQVNFLTRSFPQFVTARVPAETVQAQAETVQAQAETAQAQAETASTSVGSLPVQDLRLNRGDNPITYDFIGHL